jgi:acetate CoA/acetoacetate CoA-transferase alpha subunit
MSKIISMEEAISKVNDGMVVMIGGFMAAGTPNNMMTELVKKGVKNLTVICNDTGFVNIGIGKLIANKQIKKVIVSHIGTNPNTIEQFNNKELEVEFVPQGTLIERIRCGGNGLGGILTPTGLGTIVANGKQIINVNGKDYLLETPLHADVALIGASIADEAGNLYYKGTTQNFNPMMATAADTVIVEAQEVVKTGDIPMENVHTQALFVDYIVKA